MRHKSITVFFLFVSLLTFTLGCWQLYRLSWKNDLINNINSSITNPELFSQEIIDYNELTAVKLNKKYKAENQPIFIESKTYQNKVGYHAIIPLFFNDEIYSVLNLGWFANKNDSNVEKIINKFNQKRDVIVYLRFLTSKKNLFVPENNLDSNTWYSINHDDLEKYFQDTIISPYYFVLLDSEIKFDTNPIVFLRNNHLNYSITWFLLSLSSIVMLIIIRRKNE
ncbi:MAG: SURF1 family protein [alpha proteobacterium HIMB59]|nr:MAG: SURF1 family protein [alpha proteobacterium HIMB59]